MTGIDWKKNYVSFYAREVIGDRKHRQLLAHYGRLLTNDRSIRYRATLTMRDLASSIHRQLFDYRALILRWLVVFDNVPRYRCIILIEKDSAMIRLSTVARFVLSFARICMSRLLLLRITCLFEMLTLLWDKWKKASLRTLPLSVIAFPPAAFRRLDTPSDHIY